MRKAGIVLMVLLLTVHYVNAQSYHVYGNLKGFKSNSKIQLLDGNDNTINNTQLKDGTFILTGKLKDGPQYLNIAITEGKHEYKCTFFAGAGNVIIKGNKAQFPYNLSISGPAEQEKYNTYQKSLKPYNLQRQALMNSLNTVKQGDTATNNKMVRQYNAISKVTDTICLKYFFNNPEAYYAANEIYDFQHQLSNEKFKQFYASLSPNVKKSIYGKRLLLSISPVVQINDPIFDFTAVNQDGKSQKLSDFKGKYILLDFSSIFCGPCNESIDELRMLSQKYKAQLEVITFSTDSHKYWLQGVKDDHITWTSLSDGKGYFSEPVLRYGVSGIPNFVFISPEGKVLDKWDSYGKPTEAIGDLEKKILTQINK